MVEQVGWLIDEADHRVEPSLMAEQLTDSYGPFAPGSELRPVEGDGLCIVDETAV